MSKRRIARNSTSSLWTLVKSLTTTDTLTAGAGDAHVLAVAAVVGAPGCPMNALGDVGLRSHARHVVQPDLGRRTGVAR